MKTFWFGDLHCFEFVETYGVILAAKSSYLSSGVATGHEIKRNVYQTGNVCKLDKSNEVWGFYSARTYFTTC